MCSWNLQIKWDKKNQRKCFALVSGQLEHDVPVVNKDSSLEDVVKKVGTAHGITLSEVGIVAATTASKTTTSGKNIKNKLKSVMNSAKKHLKPDSLASTESAQAYMSMLEIFQDASIVKDDLVSLIKDKKYRDIQ